MNEHPKRWLLMLSWLWLAFPASAIPAEGVPLVLPLKITSQLPGPRVCADPVMNFAAHIAKAGQQGVLDPNSLQVINRATGQVVPHSLSRHFQHGDKGRVRWLIEDPRHTAYEVQFRVVDNRPIVQSPSSVPLIGVGDLLHYNRPQPGPLGGLATLSRLVDLTGDGRADLVYAGMYTYQSGWPDTRIPNDWGGVFCRPRVGPDDQLVFGDSIPLRYQLARGDSALHGFTAGYMHADVADLNRDGLPDLLFTTALKSSNPSRIKDVHRDVHFFLNSGDRDDGGMPIFIAAGRTPHPENWWGPVRAVDLNSDGALDLVFGGMFRDQPGAHPETGAFYVKNLNPRGWPFQAATPVRIEVGRRPCFYDVDGDRRLDAVCLMTDQRTSRLILSSRMGWRKNQGGDPPRFAPAAVLEEVNLEQCDFVAASLASADQTAPLSQASARGKQASLPGVIVSHRRWQRAALMEQEPAAAAGAEGRARFVTRDMLSQAAEVVLSDQATPFPCDWDADGDWDLLVGGGAGRVRILINTGTNTHPTFANVQPVLAGGQPIVVHMSNIFPGLEEYYHDMGYPHPAFVDWDADGLGDLLVPNISNRIFWYKNVGTRTSPKFGPRRQIICDGFPETRQTLGDTARLLGAEQKQWKKRVADPNSPFGWRSRGGFGDFNGDGLMDVVTTDGQGPRETNGYARQSALFVQYRDQQGLLRLRRERVITTSDGHPLKNVDGQPAQIIPVDWDRDGRLDLIINHGRTMDTAPALVRNIGTRTQPEFSAPRRLKCFGVELAGIAKHGPYYGVGDMDGDGRPDLLACTEMGTYHFFRRTALDMARRPTFLIGQPRVR